MASECQWPENVGILGLELYFPRSYVDQSELELFDGVSSGKYTIGLGQQQMGFCSDNEDIHSICLTAATRLLEKMQVDVHKIGRLEVGTETVVDKSKSVKTVLMSLFGGNNDVEGCDTTNACYGGTQALFNATNWIESSSWDGRLALVVAGDIAVYAPGPARCTGGAGACAMLVGPNAPLVLERGVRAFHMQHTYDFYKPDLSSEYATVDGSLSVKSYLSALDACYQRYCTKARNILQFEPKLTNFTALLFHCPYSKLVQKSLARLSFHDYLRFRESDNEALQVYESLPLDELYFDRDFEKACLAQSSDLFQEKTLKTLKFAKRIGNMYTPSLYSSLCALICDSNVNSLLGAQILLFSYGSGLASAMFSIRIRDDRTGVEELKTQLQDANLRLEARNKRSPVEFTKALQLRENLLGKAPYQPQRPKYDDLFPGTYYLSKIDEKYRRAYERTPLIENVVTCKVL